METVHDKADFPRRSAVALLTKALSAAIVFVVVARAAAALMFTACDFPKRTAVYFIEPQMVHFARCAQHGESLYPEWKNFPYIADIYTPGYFWIVGLISRAVGADLDGVMRVGRATTIAFSLFGAAAVGWVVRSKGRFAIATASGFAIGSVLMMGFGGMVRPDVTADGLGFVGFLAATSSSSIVFAGMILAAAILCKQSAAIFLIASAAASLWMNRRARAIRLSAFTTSVVCLALAMIWLGGERRVFESVFFEAGSPWRWEQWTTIVVKFLVRSGDVALLCAVGALRWCSNVRPSNATGADDAKRSLTLLMVAGGFALFGVAKAGSDLNYFLPLRYVAAVVLAEQATLLRDHSSGRWRVAGSLMLLVALILWSTPWWNGLRTHEAFDPDRNRMARIYQTEIDAIERSAGTQRIFTNCDDAALRVGNPFLDAYAFRLMVDVGRLRPTVLVATLRNGGYDRIVTTGPLEDPTYRDSPFAPPLAVTDAILERYEKVSQGALVYYRLKP